MLAVLYFAAVAVLVFLLLGNMLHSLGAAVGTLILCVSLVGILKFGEARGFHRPITPTLTAGAVKFSGAYHNAIQTMAPEEAQAQSLKGWKERRPVTKAGAKKTLTQTVQVGSSTVTVSREYTPPARTASGAPVHEGKGARRSIAQVLKEGLVWFGVLTMP